MVLPCISRQLLSNATRRCPTSATRSTERGLQARPPHKQLRCLLTRTAAAISVNPPSSETQPTTVLLDRADHIRADPKQLANLARSDHAQLLPLSSGCALLKACDKDTNSSDTDSDGLTEVCHTWDVTFVAPLSKYEDCLDETVPVVFLGLNAAGSPVFTAEMLQKDDGTDDSVDEDVAVETGSAWTSVRTEVAGMRPEVAHLVATACGIVEWHKRNKFCAVSGLPLQSTSGGWALKSPHTRRSIYPRIDPAVIMLVTCGDYTLLGRNTRWSKARYSTLAGFAEVGESLERAVAREVLEESGIQVDPESIKYVSSQPWPFPQSLMLGFTSSTGTSNPHTGADQNESGLDLLSPEARRAAIDSLLSPAELDSYLGGPQHDHLSLSSPTAQTAELSDVRWFHYSWLSTAITTHPPPDTPVSEDKAIDESSFNIPGPYSLANRMVTSWIRERESASGGPDDWSGADVPDCDIDEGRFKYVLIRASDLNGRSKLLVRGYTEANYHNDVFQRVKHELRGTGLTLEPVGGGRIEHYAKEETVHVFGYSVAFGPALHEVSVAIVRAAHPFYDPENVACSYDGY